MDFNHLWFIKCDAVLFSEPLNNSDLQAIFKNQLQFLIQCQEPGLQRDLYDILQVVDAFFSSERIIELVRNKQQIYTDDELMDIEEKTTEFRILIECEKFYANEFWINKKREWVVEVRILACLLRLYFFMVKVWELFVGDFVNIKTKMKKYKLILPLTLLEPLINDIYGKLQRIETFYYKHQYPYILEIHLLLKSFKHLLTEFPVITKQEVVKDLQLKLVILCENEKYKNNYVGKFFKAPDKYASRKKPQTRPRRITDIVNEENKRKSLDMQKTWAKRFSMSIKIYKPSTSLEVFTEEEEKSPVSPKLQFRPIVIEGRSKQNTQTSMQRTNSECGSVRNISMSRTNFLSKFSALDEFGNHLGSPRETMSPTRLPKASPRRVILQSQIVSAIKQQAPKILLENNFQETMKEKEQVYYPLLKYHAVEIRENRKRTRSWKFKIGDQEMEIIGHPKEHKQEHIDAEIEKLLGAKECHIRTVSHNKYFKDNKQQQ